MVQHDMQGKATETQLNHSKNQWTTTAGYTNYNSCNQFSNKSRNKILIQEETTPQSTTLPDATKMCKSTKRYVAGYTKLHGPTSK
jgi:hypothetical protein